MSLGKRLRLVELMLRARIRKWRMGAGGEEKFSDIHSRTPIRTFYPGKLFDPLGIRLGLEAAERIPACGLSPRRVACDPQALSGRRLVLELDPAHSFFGDCLRVVDAPGEKPVLAGLPAFGWSGAPLLAGHALTISQLTGRLQLEFRQPRDGYLPFALHILRPLVGQDGELSSPDGYRLDVSENAVTGGELASEGLLELATGRLYDFYLSLRFSNSAVDALLRCNPGLQAPPLDFPGLPHAGHNVGHLATHAAQVELRLAAQLFLPLGEGTDEAPLTMPRAGDRPSFAARNSSLHPFLQLRARTHQEPRRRRGDGPADFESLQDSVLDLPVAPGASWFGDVFALRAPHLEGTARGQSAVFGQLRVQFGRIHRGYLPFVLRLAPPNTAFGGRFRQALGLLPPGTQQGLLGIRGRLSYGRHRYEQSGLCLMSDAQKLSIGVFDARSGSIVEPFIMRNYLFLSLFEQLVLREPRTPTDSFAYSCRGRFLRHGGRYGGRLQLDLRGETHIPYPRGYRFPLTRGSTEVDEGSFLAPFLRLSAGEAEREAAPPPCWSFRAARLLRGVEKGAEILGGSLDEQTLTLNYRWGTVEARVLRVRTLRWPGHRTYLADAEAQAGSRTRRQPVLLALQAEPEVRLIVTSERQDLDCESSGELVHS